MKEFGKVPLVFLLEHYGEMLEISLDGLERIAQVVLVQKNKAVGDIIVESSDKLMALKEKFNKEIESYGTDDKQ